MKSFSLSLSQIIFLVNRSFLIAACQVVAMSAVFFGLAVVVAEARFGSLDILFRHTRLDGIFNISRKFRSKSAGSNAELHSTQLGRRRIDDRRCHGFVLLYGNGNFTTVHSSTRCGEYPSSGQDRSETFRRRSAWRNPCLYKSSSKSGDFAFLRSQAICGGFRHSASSLLRRRLTGRKCDGESLRETSP